MERPVCRHLVMERHLPLALIRVDPARVMARDRQRARGQQHRRRHLVSSRPRNCRARPPIRARQAINRRSHRCRRPCSSRRFVHSRPRNLWLVMVWPPSERQPRRARYPRRLSRLTQPSSYALALRRVSNGVSGRAATQTATMPVFAVPAASPHLPRHSCAGLSNREIKNRDE